MILGLVLEVDTFLLQNAHLTGILIAVVTLKCAISCGLKQGSAGHFRGGR